MKKLLEIITRRWIINTSKTILLIAILIAVYIAVNWGIQKLDFNDIDITKEKIFSLSEESKEKAKNIKQETSMYLIGYTEEATVYKLGKQYHTVNDKITVELVDSKNNPELLERYNIEEGMIGIVIKAGEREKVLADSELITYDYSTWDIIDVTEQKLTNAILDLNTIQRPKLYFVVGHNEYSLINNMQMLGMYLMNEINDFAEIDLLSNAIPEDCDVLIFMSPEKDFTDYEVELIKSYIEKGGNLLWLNDTKTTKEELPNMQKILDMYGITFEAGMITETDTNKMVLQDARLIKPDIHTHKITQHLTSAGGIMLMSSGEIGIADEEKQIELGIQINTLIEASSTAVLEEEYGPFIAGVEVVKDIDETTKSKLIAIANNIFISDILLTIGDLGNQQLPAISLYNNKDFILNTVAYLSDREDSIIIRKDTHVVTYTATQKQDTIIRIVIFTIPMIIILSGIVVWQVRRRKK